MPEVDGLRFLAITMVVVFHILGYVFIKYFDSISVHDTGMIASAFNKLVVTLPQGVELFFVISGFVLSLPFAKYYLKGANELSIKKFYMRRLTRLEPPYILILTLLFFLNIATHKYTFHELLPSYFASLFYMHNIIFDHTPLITVVAWSLEVEIQFYIIAPIIALLFKFNKSLRYAIWIGIIILFPILQKLYTPSILSLYQFIQYFILGFLLADIYVNAEKCKDSIWVKMGGFGVLFLILFNSYKESVWHEYTFILSVFVLCYFVLLGDYWRNIFSKPWLAIIGGMCYTIYLVHYPLISFFGGLLMKILPHSVGYQFLAIVFVLLLGTIIFSVSAFYFIFIEKPCMDHHWPAKLINRIEATFNSQKKFQNKL